MIFGYARVSTQSQNLDRQLDALKTYGVPDVRLFVEKISCTTKERPELQKLQQFLRDGDILVIDRQGDDRHACWGAVMTAAENGQCRTVPFRPAPS